VISVGRTGRHDTQTRWTFVLASLCNMAPVMPLSMTGFYFLPVWSDEALFSGHSLRISGTSILGVGIGRELSLVGRGHLSLAMWIELITELGVLERYASGGIVGRVWSWPRGLVIRVWWGWGSWGALLTDGAGGAWRAAVAATVHAEGGWGEETNEKEGGKGCLATESSAPVSLALQNEVQQVTGHSRKQSSSPLFNSAHRTVDIGQLHV